MLSASQDPFLADDATRLTDVLHELTWFLCHVDANSCNLVYILHILLLFLVGGGRLVSPPLTYDIGRILS